VADLRGKRVAFTRGSSAHNSVAALLEAAGLTLADVTEVHLAPSDAAAAFAQGGIDGWVIWDPFFTSARQQGARVLDGGTQLPPSAAFMLAHRDFVATQPDVLKRTLDALAAEGRWAVENRPAVAEMLARETGLPLALLQDTVQREDFTLTPLSDDILTAQQTAADRFARLGLIPNPVQVADMAWREWRPT
jgi:sulfonate transport system substrate-binding protein